MNSPQVSKVHFPQGYMNQPTTTLDWGEVLPRIREAKNYWLCTVRPDGKPHSIPKWAVWIQDRLYFDGSPQTRHARNIINNPWVTVHLEDGDSALIMEGRCQQLTAIDPALREPLAAEYCRKYEALGYCPEPEQWQDDLFEIRLTRVLTWTTFNLDPTKFSFE